MPEKRGSCFATFVGHSLHRFHKLFSYHLNLRNRWQNTFSPEAKNKSICVRYFFNEAGRAGG
jgi:hypothetical protein